MTPTAAIDLVLRSAKAWANGHEDCTRILRAVEKVREMTTFRAEPRKGRDRTVNDGKEER